MYGPAKEIKNHDHTMFQLLQLLINIPNYSTKSWRIQIKEASQKKTDEITLKNLNTEWTRGTKSFFPPVISF